MVLVGARLVDSRAITAGALVTFILLIQGMFKPTRRIIKEWNTVGKIYASVERIGELSTVSRPCATARRRARRHR